MAKKEIEEARENLAQAGYYLSQVLELLIANESYPNLWGILRAMKEVIANAYFDLLETPEPCRDDAEM